jgi:predicted SnoaL-like aldol condensation-catalyzing enzyme
MVAADQHEASKQLVLDFLRESIASRDPGAAGKFVTDDYHQHAPDPAEGPWALETYIRLAFDGQERDPAAAADQLTPVFTIAEDDLVTVCLYVPQPESGDPGRTYDCFFYSTYRIQGGKIAECWPNIHKYVPLHQPPSLAAGHDRATRPGHVGATDLRANKRLVRDFYARVFGALDPGAVRHFVADDYHQHAAHMPQGRRGFEGMVRALASTASRAGGSAPAGIPPAPDVLVAEGDIVAIAACLPQPEPDGSGATWPYYAYDAYRVKNGKLAEHWSGINKAAPPQHG